MPNLNYLIRTATVMLLLATSQRIEAGDGRQLPETDLAAPGAPLYETAVNESVKTLMSKQEQETLDAQSRPPSPGPDYFWCANCKTYHKRPPQQQGQQAGANKTPNTVPAASPQPAAVEADRPPSPGPDFYWCENCKTYHQRQPQQSGQQAGADQTPGSAPLAPPQQAADGTVRPPSPGPDFYWCENCKTYHKRKPQGTIPAPPEFNGAPPAAGAPDAKAQSGDLYYCENCKVYHRRQAQQSVEGLILNGVTNSPNLLIDQ